MAYVDSNKGEIDIAAVLDVLVYTTDGLDIEGKTISDAIKDLPDCTEKTIVVNAIAKNKDIGKIEITSTSASLGYSTDQVCAASFKDPSGNIYVAYRGTGDGKWPDNGEGMYKESTVMQRNAAEYFDKVIEKYGLEGYEDGNIIVTGHSKGGNNAQYTTLASEHGDLVDACYSLDGQGFSDAAIEKFEQMPDYQDRLDKMYSICGTNDYVHEFGHKIISDDHTYYMDNGDAPVGRYHHIAGMVDENGGLLWDTDENGNILHGEEGEACLYARKLSERVMSLPAEERQDVCIGLMDLLERYFKYNDLPNGGIKYGVGEVKNATWEEHIGFLYRGLPIIISELIGSPEGRALLKDLLGFLVEEVVKEMGPWGAASLAILACGLTPLFIALGLTAQVVITIGEIICETIEKIKEISTKVKNAVTNFVNAVIEDIKKLSNYAKEHSAGGKYASSNPFVKVDTSKLRNYDSRIKAVNSRIRSIDGRLNGLYKKVDIDDLLKLIKADILTGTSYTLIQCSDYLLDTAGWFETAEQKIIGA